MNMFEKIAELEHIQWAGWMEYIFQKSVLNQDGTVTIPKWAVERWTRQMNTTYLELPDEEKQSDRKEAARVMEIIKKTRIKQLGA